MDSGWSGPDDSDPRTPISTGGRPVVPSRGALRPLGLGEVRITGGFWAARQQVNGDATLDHARSWMDKLGWTGNFTTARPAASRGPARAASSPTPRSTSSSRRWRGRPAAPVTRTATRDIVELTGTYRGGAVAGRLPQHGVRPRVASGPATATWRRGTSSTAPVTCCRPPSRAASTGVRGPLLDVARRAADHVCDTFGPDGRIGPLRAPGDRGRARRAGAGHRRAALPRPGRALRASAAATGRCRRTTSAGPTPATTSRCWTRRCCAGTRCVRCTWPAVRSTSRWRPATTSCWARSRRSSTARWPGAPTSPAAWARGTPTRPSARTSSCPPTARTPRRARGSPRSCWRGGCCWPRENGATPTSSSASCTTSSPRRSATTAGRFFYANTLHQREPTPSCCPTTRSSCGFGGGPRAPWFEVSCCLPNIARLLASLSTYLVTADDDGLRIHQYADAEIDTSARPTAAGWRCGCAPTTRTTAR